jgi:enoyl-CoA hydratase
MSQSLIISSIEPGIVQIQFQSPHPKNHLDFEALQTLLKTIQNFSQTSQNPTRILILTGAGTEYFSAGYELESMLSLAKGQALQFAVTAQEVGKALENSPLITIAKINGLTEGLGAELALACDLVFAANHAKIGLSAIQKGLNPGMGGLMRLLRHVGLLHAKELIFSGRLVEASEAAAMGLITRAVPSEKLDETVLGFAQTLLTHDPEALLELKKMMHDFVENQGMHFKIDAEVKLFSKLFENFRQLAIGTQAASKKNRSAA